MTLIAYSTDYGDHAEIMTDTLAYSDLSEELTHTTKAFPLTHLDAVVIPHGDGDFGNHVGPTCRLEANHAGTFDRLAESAPEWISALWNRLTASLGRDLGIAQVHLIGYSENLSRFVAYRYTSTEDFAQREAVGMQIYPTPWSMRPPEPEREAIRAALASHPQVDQILTEWDAQPAAETPHDVAGWVAVAQDIREERALEPFCRTPVGGQVFHTTLRRGRTVTRRIHTFNDSGDEFVRLVSGTNHPIGLAAACPCGSGKTFRECCAVDGAQSVA